MQVYFWGTRGSLPYSLKSEQIEKKINMALNLAIKHGLRDEEKIEDFIRNHLEFAVKSSYGCNTSCVEVRDGGSEFILCDAGTGLRDFGNHVMDSGLKPPQTFHIFISHLHWDHICGFPFFTPAYIPGNRVNIYGFHDHIEDSFERQQEAPNFPLPLKAMGSEINFHQLNINNEYQIAGVNVLGIKQNHPGDSYGYSFVQHGRKVVYSTDAEHQKESEEDDYYFLRFIENADLLIFDAQYNLADHFFSKQSWGHSSNLVGVELAVRSKVKQLCLFHHEHTLDDHELDSFLADTRRYLQIYDEKSQLQVKMAYEGLLIELD